MALCAAASLCLCAVPGAARDGWIPAPGAADLISNGGWSCANGVDAAGAQLTIAAGSGYNTAVNTNGPLLHVTGDFSVSATLSSAQKDNVFLTLVGTLNSGEWWNGLKRLDVGLNAVNYWTGSSSTAVMKPLAVSSTNSSVTVEAARIGPQIVIFLDGAEALRFDDPGLFASGNVYLGFNVAPQSSLTVSALAANVPASGGGSVMLYTPGIAAVTRSNGMRETASKVGFYLGAAVDPSLFNDPAYTQTLGSQFNMVVAENAMKFAETEPAFGKYSYCQADRIVAFAQANQMAIRAHNLVWQQDLPAWLTGGNYSAGDAASILQDHIMNVATHFRGKVVLWDVVNEAISYGQPYGPQPSYWLNTIGSNYVDMAFRWAHQADPGAKLFYNDTGGEGLGAKSDAVFNLVQGLVTRGVPVNGVGLQMHVSLAGAPSAADIATNIKRLTDLGLEVQITEMDVRLKTPASSSDLIAQAKVYQDVLNACLGNSMCTALVTWGVTDAHSWIPGSYPGFGSALLFDENLQAKPAASAIVSVLNSASAMPRVFNGGAVIHGGVSRVVSPGSLVDVYGNALAGTAAEAAASSDLPRALTAVQAVVDAAPAPVLYVSPGLVIFQMPNEIAPGAHTVSIFQGGSASPPVNIYVQPAAPSILTYGANRAVALNGDYSVNSASNCAAQGSTAVTYLTGSGPVDHAIPTGKWIPLSPLSQETLATTVTVNGVNANVRFSGLAPSLIGLMQINFDVPATMAGDGTLQISIGGALSNTAAFCVGN